MRIDHIFFELETFLRDQKAHAKLRGPRMRYNFEYCNGRLEAKIKELRESLEKINYVEVD